MQLKIREMIPDDRNFILATWLRSYRQSPFTKHIPNIIFFDAHQRLIEQFWAKPSSSTLIASLDEDPMVILGYLALDPSAIHFCFVKETLQSNGVARALLKHAHIDLNEVHSFTHFTKPMETAHVKYRTLRYNPYLFPGVTQ